MAAAAPDLSVIIITKNEERRLPACLRSLPGGAEIIVLDSGSTDATREVAAAWGAVVKTRVFDNYSMQKNAALTFATRRWVLSLDADEVLEPELAAALAALTSTSAPEAAQGYRLRRRLVFQGRRLRFGKAVDYPVRLMRRGAGTFSAEIHEHLRIDGTVKRLGQGEILHHSYDDLTDYFRRFNDYTSRIAANHLQQGRGAPRLIAHVLRPWGEFFSRYILRLGFLDGYQGYTYALVSSLYAFIKYAKLRELQQAAQPLDQSAKAPWTR